jgi:hypothetical protein
MPGLDGTTRNTCWQHGVKCEPEGVPPAGSGSSGLERTVTKVGQVRSAELMEQVKPVVRTLEKLGGESTTPVSNP